MLKEVKSILIIVLIVIAFIVFACNINITIETTGNPKIIPIYSVETDKKAISISFDAAWADVIYGLCIES